MIFGIGTDLLRIERGEGLWQRHGARAVEKLLRPEEKDEFDSNHQPGHALARAFAVKEAFVKALGTGFHGVSYQDVGVSRQPKQRPRLVFSDSMQTRLDGLGITSSHLSLSDEAGMILAFVVLESSAGHRLDSTS